MATTKVWVKVDQKAAIEAGKKEFGDYLVEVDPAKFTEEERSVLAFTSKWSPSDLVYYAVLQACPVPDTSDESIRKLITAALAKKAKKEKAEKEKAEKEKIREVEEEKEKERIKAEEAKVRQAKKDFLDAWVLTHGTESQKERHSARLLPSEELFGAITDHIFAPLNNKTQYVKMQESDCEHTEQCASYDNEGCCDVEWDVEDAEGATSEEWERMKALKVKLGVENAVITLQEHTGETDCKNRTTKMGILITVEVECGYSFNREYGA